MGVNRDEAELLLGAWALDALDEADRGAVDALVDTDPELGRIGGALRRAVAVLGEQDASTPPPASRGHLMNEVARRPATAQRATPSAPLDVVVRQIEALDTLLDSLDEEQWKAAALPYSWTVHGLVAHLLVIEQYTARMLGLAPIETGDAGDARDVGDAGEEDHLSLGASTIAAELHRPPRETMAAWKRRAEATVAAVAAWSPSDHDRPVSFHGWPFSVDSMLIARGFEMWTHADDIRRATGRGLDAPRAEDLRAMSTFSVNSLPLLLPVVAPHTEAGRARIVLTGPGGGTFDLGDPASARRVTLVADVVDYCRQVARRLDAADLPSSLEGDEELAGALMAAARVFAM